IRSAFVLRPRYLAVLSILAWSRSCPCRMESIAVEKRAKSLSPGTPRSARRPRIRFTLSGVKPSLLPTSRPLFHTRRLGARFLAMAFRSDVWSTPIPRASRQSDMGFTIARIIWQVWHHHEAAPLSKAQFVRVCRALAALAEG